MADEQQDPPGADRAPDDEPAVDQPSAHEREEVDEDIPTTDPAEARNPVQRTIRFGFAGLRATPVIPLDLLRVVRKNQEDLAKAISSRVLASKELRDAWRPVIPPHLLRVMYKRQEDWPTVMRSRARASNVLWVAWRPVVPPDLFRVVSKHQEIWAKTLRRFAAGLKSSFVPAPHQTGSSARTGRSSP